MNRNIRDFSRIEMWGFCVRTMNATGHADDLPFIRRAAKLISRDELEAVSIFEQNHQFAAFCTAVTLGAPDEDLRKMLKYSYEMSK